MGAPLSRKVRKWWAAENSPTENPTKMKNTTKPVKLNLQYQFTRDELIAIGKDLGESVRNLRQLDDDFKMIRDEWKAKISAAEAHVASLSNKTASGYEFRDLDCTATMHDPKPGMKTIRRDDTGETVKMVAMEEREMQAELDLEARENAPGSLAKPIDEAIEAAAQKANGEDILPPDDEVEDDEYSDAELVEKWNALPHEGETGALSTSQVQRALDIGFAAANRLIAALNLEAIGNGKVTKARKGAK